MKKISKKFLKQDFINLMKKYKREHFIEFNEKLDEDIIKNASGIWDFLIDYAYDKMSEYDIYTNDNGTITIAIDFINKDHLIVEIGETLMSGYFEPFALPHIRIKLQEISVESLKEILNN